MGKVYVNENNILLAEMIKIYKPVDIDWMSYQVTRDNGLSIHHIKKQCSGGETIISNCAIITKKGHRALNIV